MQLEWELLLLEMTLVLIAIVSNPPTVRLMRVMLNETSISSVQPNADNELPSTSSGYSLRPNRIRVPPEQLSRSESLESIISTTTIASSNQRIDITQTHRHH